MKPQSKEEKLMDLLQVILNNLHLLGEIKNTLEETTDRAINLLNQGELKNEKDQS